MPGLRRVLVAQACGRVVHTFVALDPEVPARLSGQLCMHHALMVAMRVVFRPATAALDCASLHTAAANPSG